MKPYLRNIFAASAACAALAGCGANVAKDDFGGQARRLTSNEIAMAQQIFGNQIDYRRVTIRARMGKTSDALNGHIRMARGLYSNDYASPYTSLRAKQVFMHEMVHVWQHQRGVDVVGEAVSLFFEHGGDYSQSYNYNINTINDYNALSIEQQAEIIENYYGLSASLNRANANINCPQILSHERVIKPIFPSIRTPKLCR